MKIGGIVLCGGQSRRMGRLKAMLPFGDEVMLIRVLRLLSEVVEPLIVVASPTQTLPSLPRQVELVRDRSEGQGPLEGLYCGLVALGDRGDAAYATACDVPLLRPDFVRYLIAQLGEADVVIPVEGAFYHPLAAVYRTRIIGAIGDCVTRQQLRMTSFHGQTRIKPVPVQQLRKVDDDLQSLMNVNSPADYRLALQRAGLSVERLK